jgi:hypothetical protein
MRGVRRLMPRIFVFMALLFGAVEVANAGAWTLVMGGDWIPDDSTLAQMKRTAKLSVTAAARGRKLPRWRTYEIQYRGELEGGKRTVRVLGVCDGFPTRGHDLHVEFQTVLDGGTCVFFATYDADAKRYSQISFGGEA